MEKKILIYGMGTTGKAVKKFCENNKIKYFTFDDNKDKKNKFKKLIKNTSKIILSPGIPRSNDNVKFAINKKIDVISEIEFASEYLKKPLIAITGTNGKTTTCLLTYTLLKDLGKKVFLGGNIGKPLISSLNKSIKYDLYLVECSSFQLQFIKNKFSPFISMITNLSPNHLDHHKNLKEYYESKYKIFSNQKRDSYFISNIKNIENKNKFFKLKKINFITCNLKESKKYIIYKKIKIDKNKLNLIGSHNFTNIINSLEILSIFNEPNKKTLDSLYKFTPPAFRLEKILNKPYIYNDSKSTSPGATAKALDSFDKKIYLIMGGKDKNLDYMSIKEIIKRKAKKLFLYGENKFKLSKYLNDINYEICVNLESAVQSSLVQVKPNDIILFSPGTSSFDQFKSYIERGKSFNSYVRQFT